MSVVLYRVIYLALPSLAIISLGADFDMSDQRMRAFESKDHLTLEFSLDPERGVYKISLRNDGPHGIVFADLFSHRGAKYERAPLAVSLYVRVNGEFFPNPLRSSLGGHEGFNPHDDPSRAINFEDFANEICDSCVVERSFDLEYILDDALERILLFYDQQINPAGDSDFLWDIRELDVRMTSSVILLRNWDHLSVETDWIALPPEKFARGYRKPGTLHQPQHPE